MEQKHYFDMLKEARHKLGHEAFRALVLQVEDDAVAPQGNPITPPCPQGYYYDTNLKECVKKIDPIG